MVADVNRRSHARAWEIGAGILLIAALAGSVYAYAAFRSRARRLAPRPWSPEQATGAPDTPQPGDIQTAWASLTPDGQDEWLELQYPDPVVPTQIQVYETCNPGALRKVSVFGEDGAETVAWTGKDPAARTGTGISVAVIPVNVSFRVSRVKLYLGSRTVSGWNEIDAVELDDASGQPQWAAAARASSTYANR